MLFFWATVLVISLVILVKSADYFIASSEKVGLILGISPFFIGVTIVAFGTSLPELLTSIFAVWDNAGEIVAGNVIGSNIANILLVAGLTAVIAGKIKIKRDIVNLDLPLLLSATAGLTVMIAWDRIINFYEGVVALLFYFVYFFYLYKTRQDTVSEELQKKWEETKAKIAAPKMTFSLIAVLVLSGIFLVVGAKLTVISALKISTLLGITASAIALSAIAVGTSLPELAVTIRAANNGNGDMAIGNIFGSNLFNGSFIIGVSSLLGDLPISSDILFIAIPFLVIATVLYTFSGLSQRVYNYEGAMFVLIYVIFLAKLFNVF